jgi:hypothetical protein
MKSFPGNDVIILKPAAFYAGVTSAGTWRKDEFDGRVSSGRRGFG